MTNLSAKDEIFCAISSGDMDLIQAILASGMSPDAENSQCERALTVAARNNLPEIVAVLLKAGAKPSMLDREEESPLATAVAAGYLEVVQTILQLGGVAKKDRQVAMMKAIRLGRPLQMIELLLRLPDDFQIEWSESGIDLLGWAVQEEHIPAAKLLLERGIPLIKPRANWTSALHIAAAKGFQELVKIMVEAGADITARNGEGLTPLMVSCYNGQRVVAAYLAERMRRKDLDIHDNRKLTAMHYAIMKAKEIDMLRLLLDRDADPNLCPPTASSALYAAVRANCPDIADCLLDYWAKPSSDGEIREIWYITITKDYLGLIPRLIDNEVDPNISIVHGYTPLHLAVRQNRSDAVEELLKGGANPNCVTDMFQLTPLHMASSLGQAQIISQLLENGADVNARAFDGATPLLHATRTLHGDIVKILLSSGGNPDMIDAWGLTVFNYVKGNVSIEKVIKEFSDLLQTSPERVLEDTPSPPPLPQSFHRMYSATFDGIAKLSVADDELYLEVYKDWAKTAFESTLFLSTWTKNETLFRQAYSAYADRWHFLFKEKLSLLCRWCQGYTSDEIYQCESCITVRICGGCANRYTQGDAFENCQGHQLWHISLELHDENGQIVSAHQMIQHSNEILSNVPGEASATTPPLASPGKTPKTSTAPLGEVKKHDEIPIEPTRWIELKKWESIVELDSAIKNKESQLRHLEDCDTTDVESYWTYSLWLCQRYVMDPNPDTLIKLTAAAANTKLLSQKTTSEKKEIYYLTARVRAFTFMSAPPNPTSCTEAFQEVREGICVCPPHTIEREVLLTIFVWIISALLKTNPQNVPFLEDCLSFTKEALANSQYRDVSQDPEGLETTDCELTLGSLFTLRYRQSHARSDLEDAIKHTKNALMRLDAEEGNVDVDTLLELSDLLDNLYEETGAKQSLDEAISSLRRICSLETVSLADFIHAKNNCAYYLRKRYLLTANLSDLEDSFKLAEETLQLFQDKRINGSLAHSAALTNIANILDQRYERLKERADLESSITYEREALAVAGISPSERVVKLSNQAQRHKVRYEQFGVLEDVEQGISLAKEALCIPNIGREAQVLTINSFCNLLSLRADRLNSSSADWRRIVRLRKIALGLCSAASCAINFHNLAVVLTK
jgi:ankyrin repeat protein